jgi:hypothetical protein
VGERSLPLGGEGICPDLDIARSRERERIDDSPIGLTGAELPRGGTTTGGVEGERISVTWVVDGSAGFRLLRRLHPCLLFWNLKE